LLEWKLKWNKRRKTMKKEKRKMKGDVVRGSTHLSLTEL
jgi:hypothetical protein